MIAQFIIWLLLLPGMSTIQILSKPSIPPLIAKNNLYQGANIPIEVIPCFKNGDLILRTGYGLISNSIITVLNEPRAFSHVGILVLENGSWQVLHTLSGSVSEKDGIRSEPLDDFLEESRPKNLMVVRLKGGNPDTLICEAEMFRAAGIPFDQQFDLSDGSSFYCAEFVQNAMDRSGYPAWQVSTLPNGKNYLAFSHLYDKRYAEIIYDAADD